MTRILDKYFPVLDKGFIALKDYMGSDEDIEQAARISYGKGTRKATDTRNLIRYLLRHRHTSPFEMCELKFHVRVPMDCWRQWIRHRTASVNEYSSRYSEVPLFCQQTPPDGWRFQSKTNKQGSELGILDWNEAFSMEEIDLQRMAHHVYRRRIDCGIAREQARKDLPLSTYTEAFWKIDLHNLLHFLKLRCDSHAQLEIRSYANTIAMIVAEIFPITFEAWKDYSFNAKTFSAQELALLSMLTSGFDDREIAVANLMGELGFSEREKIEFYDKIDGPVFDFEPIDINESKPYESFYPKD